MCGIWCYISTSPCSCCRDTDHCLSDNHGRQDLKGSFCSEQDTLNLFDCQNEFLSRRGPDLSSCRHISIPNSKSSATYINLFSHVLWTQGEKVQQQPYGNSAESKFMLFNGDIYSFKELMEDGDLHEDNSCQNDGLKFFKLLEHCQSELEICKVLENLQGPFAFVFIDIPHGRLWFARDFFGRESLLFSYKEAERDAEINAWNISSVSVLENVLEIPTSGLFCLELESKELKLYPYSHVRESVSLLQTNLFSTLKNTGFINTATILDTKISLSFCSKLSFPERIGETVIENDEKLTALINEARLTNSSEEFLQRSIPHLSYYIDSLIEHLRQSVRRRVNTLPPFCKNCMRDIQSSSIPKLCKHSKVGVLFSGGLDSTVIAYLAAEALPEGSSLDLINVGFSKDENFSKIPDRETALSSFKMLSERFKPQGKRINLVLVNVGKAEVEEQRRARIKYLISPFKSVLDDSLGVCLWFAARGIGKLHDDDAGEMNVNYSSPIRIVLLGSGADELLGGYGRHRSAYEKLGWEGLRSEMQLDFDRISIRNMGRDNRIVSDHGICPRIPFLDEHVVDFLTGHCDLWVKCCPVNVGPLGSRGSGEKLLLRAVGAKLFGDRYLSLALFPKRAMQFGSKIAKLENSKEKGGDACHRLL